MTDVLTIWINVIQTGSCDAMLGQLVAVSKDLDLAKLFQMLNPLLNRVSL